MFIVYAHRGASEYAPQNTMRSFRLGVSQGANGIETDIQRTRDGVLVLFHDDDTDKILGVSGKISDYTYSELQEFTVRMYDGTETNEKIPKLEEFLEFVMGTDLTLALEIKQDGIEKEVVDAVKDHGLADKVTVTSFEFEHIRRVKELMPSLRVGHLIGEITEERIEALRGIGAEEICPKAELITEDDVKHLRALGFSIRAWGVFNIGSAKRMIDLEIDGMTANFPDLCIEYLKQKERR